MVWARCPKRMLVSKTVYKFLFVKLLLPQWLFQKKSLGEELRTWNFQGNWKNRIWKLQESIKKEVKFPGMIKKKIVWNYYESWFLALWFGGISRGETSSCQESPRLKWPKKYVLFQKKCFNTPCLDFFWNSPIQEHV